MELQEKIERAIEDIRPFLIADGGNIRLVEITPDLVVKVELLGNCEHCSISPMTMKAGIEHTVMTQVPEVKSVIAVNGISVNK